MTIALTNFHPDPLIAAIYKQAAKTTNFPCWVGKYPMPAYEDFYTGEEDAYTPSLCPTLWSLWTEWDHKDHSPFWREVDRLKATRDVKFA